MDFSTCSEVEYVGSGAHAFKFSLMVEILLIKYSLNLLASSRSETQSGNSGFFVR